MGCSTTAAWRPITLGLLTFLVPSEGVFFFAIGVFLTVYFGCLGRAGASQHADSGPQRCFVSDGFTFGRPKVNRKGASPLRAGPPLLSNRTLQSFDTQLPPNFRWPPASS